MWTWKRLIAFGMVAAAAAGCPSEPEPPPVQQCETPAQIAPAVLTTSQTQSPDVVLDELLVVLADEIPEETLEDEFNQRYSGRSSTPFVVYELNARFDCTRDCVPCSDGVCSGIPPIPPLPKRFRLFTALRTPELPAGQ